jgi:hypothetical protein
MVTITITVPTPGTPVPAGLPGEITAHVDYRPASTPASVRTTILDGAGHEVWKGFALLLGRKVTWNVTWPDRAGRYAVRVEALGPSGRVEASQERDFEVQPFATFSAFPAAHAALEV